MNRALRIGVAVFISWSLLISGCSKSPEEKRAAFLESAASYMKEGKYSEASIQYQNALQIAPDDVKTLVSLGEVELKLVRAGEAYKAFSKAVKIDPKNTKAHQYLASLQLLAKKYDLAEKEARAILAYEPDNKEAKEMLAQALFQSGRQNEAVLIMEGLLKSQQPAEETFINAIRMYTATGRVDDALSSISRGSSLYPRSSKIRFLASGVYAFKGDINAARKWSEEAYHVQENDINAGLTLARFYASYQMDEPFNTLISRLKTRFPKDPSPYLLESAIVQQKGDLDKSLALAQKARELQDNTLTKTAVAQILMGKGDVSGPQKILEEAVEKDTRAIPARILLAKIYLQKNNPQKALDTLDLLIKSIPRRPDVAVPAAQAYLMKGDLIKAQGIVEKSLEENKGNALLHVMNARILFSEGKYKETLSEIDLLEKNSFATPETAYVGALSAFKLGQSDRAASLVDSLKKMSPDTWQALHAQILLALSKKDKRQAYLLADKAVDLYPGKQQALAIYAGIAPAVISTKETMQKITNTCSKSNTAFCHMVLARLLETSGNVQAALNEMKGAIEMEKDNTSLYHALAQFYVRNKMIQKAIDEYEAIVNKKPNDLSAAMMLALLNQNQGKVADAKKVYSYILEREPKNALAANNLSWILMQSGKPSDLNEALRLAQIAKDKFPEDPRIADTLGYVYLKKGLAQNALAQFQLAVEKLPQEPSINYHLALALFQLARNPEARKYVESSLNSKTFFEERAEAQKLLARIIASPKK
ncbi:MAG TPA: tetratricopeptide repeat protein [Deltaproteobacteria bacterium]|jgi:tetratricopeptide (TPR) repeat protein|nr:tetratricopeptide repeat protein [Deltaproteobacteria bacterium]HQJ07356.1 tetratricopeptide repeat protein [Deltaproteobacteria bacterium]